MAFMANQTQNQMQIQEKKTANKESTYQRIIHSYQRRTSNEPISADDETKIVEILGRARSSYVVGLIEKGDEATEEDLEIIQEVQQHLVEEQKQVVTEEKVDSLICTFSSCSIPGCIVHTLIPDFIHYGTPTGSCYAKMKSMSPRMKKGYEIYKKRPGCSYIEVYERHICVVSSNGTSEVINE